jgi:hypothetical protein
LRAVSQNFAVFVCRQRNQERHDYPAVNRHQAFSVDIHSVPLLAIVSRIICRLTPGFSRRKAEKLRRLYKKDLGNRAEEYSQLIEQKMFQDILSAKGSSICVSETALKELSRRPFV